MADKDLRKISYYKVSELIPYALNTRTHDDSQVSQIAASIREFGFNNPVLIDERKNIIAGHGRVLAAKKLELEKVPCIVITGLTPAQRKAYTIADNKIALNSGWDEELLKIEIQGLDEGGFDLSLTGFSDKEIESLFLSEEEEREEGESGGVKDKDLLSANNVLIECSSESEAEKIYNEFIERGFKVKLID